MNIGNYLSNSPLAVLLPTEIYQLIIFSGIVYFILIFYGTKQWETYSEFDKIVFSVVLGGFIFYFFILPISVFMFILNVFQKPEIIIANDFAKYSYLSYFMIAAYLIGWRLLKINNKPLRDSNKFLNFTQILIVVFIIAVVLAYIALLVSFSFSTYKEHLVYIIGSIYITIPLLLVFYHAFLKILTKKESLFAHTENLPSLNLTLLKNKKLMLLIILIIPIAASIGMYFLKTTVQLVDEEKTRLEIPRMETWNYARNLTGNFDVKQYYTISFGFIPWVRIKSNISLLDSYGRPYSTDPNYTFNREYEVIINSSRWGTVNTSLIGKMHEDNLPKIYKIQKKDLNETVRKWDIIFTNPYDMYIKIYTFDIEKDRQFNKLINYNITNLDLNKESLDETLKNQAKETVEIRCRECKEFC